MTTIYKRASNVVSWLGPATVQTEAASAAFKNLMPRPSSSLIKLVNRWRPRNRITSALKDAISILVEDPEFRSAVFAITKNPYWSRVWIFQELACGRKRTFLCGNNFMMEFDLALRAVVDWGGNPGMTNGNLLNGTSPSMVSAAHTLKFRNRKFHLGLNPGRKRRQVLSWFRGDDFPFFLTLLRRLHTLHATDCRDRVYALFSIAGDRRELNIIPDYTKSIHTVFTEAASALLQCGHLSVLLDATRSNSRADLPSWVPDWTNLSELQFEPSLFHLHKSRIRQQSLTLDEISASSGHVDLDGYIVDEITLVGDTYWNNISQKGLVIDGTSPDVLKSWVESIENTI